MDSHLFLLSWCPLSQIRTFINTVSKSNILICVFVELPFVPLLDEQELAGKWLLLFYQSNILFMAVWRVGNGVRPFTLPSPCWHKPVVSFWLVTRKKTICQQHATNSRDFWVEMKLNLTSCKSCLKRSLIAFHFQVQLPLWWASVSLSPKKNIYKEVSAAGHTVGSQWQESVRLIDRSVTLRSLSQAALPLLLFCQLEVSVGQDSCQSAEDPQRLTHR